MRSIAEAVERWIWSKWIDEHYYISKVEILNSNLSELSQHHRSFFDQVLFYQMPIDVEIDGRLNPMKIGITLGLLKDGIFPGSRVCSINESPWEHALTESYRHLQIFNNQSTRFIGKGIVYDRINFFGKNKSLFGLRAFER